MMEKDLSELGAQSQLQLLPELDQNLRPNKIVLVRLHAGISLLAILDNFHNDMKLLYIKKKNSMVNTYRIAGKFGGDFNLAVWRIVRTSPNLNSRQI